MTARHAAGRTSPRARRLHIDRSRARAWALQVHYRWEAGGGHETLPEALEETRRTRNIQPRRVAMIERLVTTLAEHLAEVDHALRKALENWELDRLAAIDRGILRLGATEMLHMEDVPPKTSIQEAVYLAEAYGGHESPRFVNGVLDALYKGERAGR